MRKLVAQHIDLAIANSYNVNYWISSNPQWKGKIRYSKTEVFSFPAKFALSKKTLFSTRRAEINRLLRSFNSQDEIDKIASTYLAPPAEPHPQVQN